MKVAALILLAAVLTLGAAGAAPADPWIGKWKSVDTDGSNQALTITRRADGAYDVILFDDRASACGGIAANGVGVGTVADNTMTGTTTITCADGRVLGTFPFKGTYEPKTDTFTDGLGVVWSRVKTPVPPKAKPLPLGRLVLAAREAPGLKQRAAKPAAAKKALAAALLPGKLPAFAPKETQVSHFARGKTELWSLAFVMKNAPAAKAATAAITKAARRARSTVVVRRTRHVVAAIVLRMAQQASIRARVAADYSRVVDGTIRLALSQTAWTRALDRIGPKGQVSRKTALDTFAVAYGPLPGTKRPVGSAGRLGDGTIAARRVLRLWRTLTPAQRAEAGRLLGVTNVSLRGAQSEATRVGPAARMVLGDPNFAPNAELQSQAETFAKAFAAKLNYNLKLTIVAGGTTTPVAEAAADALPIDGSGAVSDDATVCRIRLTTSGQKDSVQYRNLTMAHEVFHCFEFDIAGPIKGLVDPDWIIEGMADWAAMSIYPVPFGSALTGPLIEYFYTCRATPLFARSYDAVGFFGHFDDSVGSFWSRVVTTLSQKGSAAAYAEAGGDEDEFLDTWASSVVVQTGLGFAWYQQSPIAPVPSTGCTELPAFGEQLTLLASEYTLWPYVLEGSGSNDRPLLHIAVKGHARLADGKVDTANLRDAWFCVGGECTCPAGTEGFPPPAPDLVLPAHLALTGGADGARASLRFESLEQYCKVKQKPPPPPCPLNDGRSAQVLRACPSGGRSPPGPGEEPDKKEDPPEPVQCYGHGCAHSAADPHLLPFDSPWYDFQGVGEFTLVRSTTDDLEVQVRQQPWPGSKVVSQNVAVAMRVAGDRVGVYSGDPFFVRVNRKPVFVGKKDVRLPGGGTIIPLRQGQLDVVWPDGSAVRVVPTGDLSTDVIVALAAARQGKVVGLLGDNDADGNDADDFTTRGGRRLDPTLIRGTGKRTYNLLYRVFGESWRVSERSSLFDYAPGQSTRTFTDRRFPARIASPGQIEAGRRRKAERICRRMRLQSPRVFRNCVLDVASTGFFSFAVSASTAERSVKKARKAPKPPPPAKPGATVRWAGKTYTFRPASSQDGCEKAGRDIKFSAQFTASPGKKLVYGFKLIVVKGTKDGVYTTNVGAVFEIENQIPVEIQNLRVTLAGGRTRGTFSGNASTPGKEPVTGSFQC